MSDLSWRKFNTTGHYENDMNTNDYLASQIASSSIFQWPIKNNNDNNKRESSTRQLVHKQKAKNFPNSDF